MPSQNQRYSIISYEMQRIALELRLKRGLPIAESSRLKPFIKPNEVPQIPLTHYQITYPQGFSEFEIQAWLYTKLHRLGYDIRGEVAARNPQARFDLVIFDANQRPTIIIEVKRDKQPVSPQQASKYEAFGVTMIYCDGTLKFRETLAYIQTLVKPTRTRKKS